MGNGARRSAPADSVVIAVTVVGGYLGAGKTTLVNQILRSADERMAVLVNDFGEINIDAGLIASHDGKTMELANGCICCSLVDGLASALVTIRDLDPRPQRLVIEASGVADPATVAAYAHGPGFALDATLVLADAETVEQRSTDRYVGDTVLGQLSVADIIVVNKIDLVTPDERARLRQWISDRWPETIVHEAEQAVVPAELLFGHEPTGEPEPGLGHARFATWSWATDRPISRASVERAMAELPSGVLRLKGPLWLADDPDRAYLLQRVGQRWSLRPVDGPPSSQLVAIGLPDAMDDAWLGTHLDER